MRSRPASALLLTGIVAGLLVTGCGAPPPPRGYANPVEAVLTVSGHAGSGATVHAIAQLPPGTLVIYSYQQHGQCGLGYGLASDRQGLWNTHAGGSREGWCHGSGSSTPLSLIGQSTAQGPLPWGLAIGGVDDPAVATVEVHWDDGTVTAATIGDDVYYAHHPAGAEAVSVHAYDADGQLLGTATRPIMRQPQPQP